MIKNTLRSIRKYLPVRLLPCIFVLCISIVGPSYAFASNEAGTHASPNLTILYCLHEGSDIGLAGPNEVNLDGTTTNYCGHTVTGNQKMVITNGCEGTLATASSAQNNPFTLDSEITGWAGYVYNVGCVTCIYSDAGVLIDRVYPNFIVFVTVTANGSFKVGPNTYYAAADGLSTSTYNVQNTGMYAPRCPPVV